MGDLGQFNVIVTNCRPDDETVALAKAQQIKVMY
jgi:DeoR family deoxyribose operon repressor